MHYVKAKSLLTRWNGMNIYRGCTHGCVYCDSRSDCYQFRHPFEDIEVKQNAPELLEQIVKRRRKKAMIGTGSMSDPYQPCEKTLCLTRSCLQILEKYGFGATVITKSDLVLRDMDLFAGINRKAKAVVQMSLTVADDDLSRILEPRVCPSKRRYEVLKEFQKEGIPTVVWMSPLLPFLTDSEENFGQLLDWCFDAGVRGIICFHIGMTLRGGNREYYYRELDRNFPGLSDVYRKRYGDAYEVVSDRSPGMMERFHAECEKRGILHTPDDCFRYTAEFSERSEQISLFDG